MKDFFEEHSGIFHIIEIVLMVIIIVFLLSTIKAQNVQIQEMSQTIEVMEENSGLNLTMDQVNKAIDSKITQAIEENNLVITKTVTQDIDSAVKESLEGYKETLYLDIYKQVTSDLKAAGLKEGDKESAEDDKKEEKEEEEKEETKTTKKPSSTSSKKTTPPQTTTPTPQVTPPQNTTPAPQVTPPQNTNKDKEKEEDDGAFIIDEEDDTSTF